MKTTNFLIGKYTRCTAAASLTIFGFEVYHRVGSMVSVLGVDVRT